MVEPARQQFPKFLNVADRVHLLPVLSEEFGSQRSLSDVQQVGLFVGRRGVEKRLQLVGVKAPVEVAVKQVACFEDFFGIRDLGEVEAMDGAVEGRDHEPVSDREELEMAYFPVAFEAPHFVVASWWPEDEFSVWVAADDEFFGVLVDDFGGVDGSGVAY